MRALFLWVYFLIVGCFFGGFYLIEYLGSDVYEKEFSSEYLEYTQRITPLIVADLKYSEDKAEVLNHWMRIIGDEINSLQIISQRESENLSGENGLVSEVSITDFSDEIKIVIPLPDEGLHFKPGTALEFHYVDAYSQEFEVWNVAGILAVYLFMAAVIGALVYILFRYLQQIKFLTSAVVSGDLKARMPASKISMFRNLSEDINHMAQELESKHLEGEVFLGAIHHELRSPLTKLRLALDMALNSQPSNDTEDAIQRELLTDMDADLDELNALMEDILMLSRLRLQDDDIELKPLGLSTIINNICNGIGDNKLILDNTDSIQVCANQVLLERAITNVITNAIKFAKNRVHIYTEECQNQVIIRISDDGPGIPEKERQLIFKPFYRFDKGRARTTGGVGLGLAIARLVVMKMKGEIQVTESQFGGACFVIQLPL